MTSTGYICTPQDTLGYVKNVFLGYTKIHSGYSEIQFKSKPTLTLAAQSRGAAAGTAAAAAMRRRDFRPGSGD